MKSYDEIRYIIEDMIDPIIKKGDISPSELDNIYKGMKTIYYCLVSDAMLDGGYSNEYNNNSNANGNSNRNYRYSYDGRQGMDGDSDGRYSERRNSRGSYNRGYSRTDERERMIREYIDRMDNER